MNRLPLSVRVFDALRLSPMTVSNLSRCLCAGRESVRQQVGLLFFAGIIEKARVHRPRMGAPASVYRIAG